MRLIELRDANGPCFVDAERIVLICTDRDDDKDPEPTQVTLFCDDGDTLGFYCANSPAEVARLARAAQ